MSTLELKPWETPRTDALFWDIFGPERDWTPNQKKAAKFARDLESELTESNSIIRLQHEAIKTGEKRGEAKAREELVSTQSALNAAREALGEIEECANNAANDNNIGRVGTIAFILLRDKAESALAQIDKALSPQQSKTT